MADMECQLDFTDITINEADGVFEDVKEIMLKEPPFNDSWVLRSRVSIVSSSGMGQMEIQFHGDMGVWILDYEPSIGDLFYNPDIQIISAWAQENGWQIPQPHPGLVSTNKDFWKHFYDTLLIDSDYLDKLYGKRPQLEDTEGTEKNG